MNKERRGTMAGFWLVLVGLGMVAILGAAAPAVALDLMDGEWESVTETVIEGMPFAIPPVTINECLTQKDPLPDQKEGEGESDCTFSENKISGNTVRWQGVCRDAETTSEVSGEITYSGKSYKGTTKVVLTDRKSGEVTKMTMKMSGRYLGLCTNPGKGPSVNGVRREDIERELRQAEVAAAEERRQDEENRRLDEERRARERAEAEEDEARARARAEVGRSYTAKGSGNAVTETVKEAVGNPARAIRGLFGLP